MAEKMEGFHGRTPATTSSLSNVHGKPEVSTSAPAHDTQRARRSSSIYASTTTLGFACSSKASGTGSADAVSTKCAAGKASAHGRTFGTTAMRRPDLLSLARLIVSPEEQSRASLHDYDVRPLLTASLEPPVTKTSLSELDIARILSDARLRHDLNFEKDVAFRPNYDGERGRRKKAVAKEYWAVLAVEFALYMERAACRDPTSLLEILAPLKVPQRLPKLFKTIQEILKTLVRGEDWIAVDQILDIDLLMQQLEKGICDLMGLSNWLGKILKGSCSPVRDPLVTNVVALICQGVQENDPVALVHGIEQLFGLLETMKLVSVYYNNV